MHPSCSRRWGSGAGYITGRGLTVDSTRVSLRAVRAAHKCIVAKQMSPLLAACCVRPSGPGSPFPVCPAPLGLISSDPRCRVPSFLAFAAHHSLPLLVHCSCPKSLIL